MGLKGTEPVSHSERAITGFSYIPRRMYEVQMTSPAQEIVAMVFVAVRKDVTESLPSLMRVHRGRGGH